MEGRTSVDTAVGNLGAYRKHLLHELQNRRLDDTHYTTLTARADLVTSGLRTRLIGPVAGRLSDDFRHIVDVALHDGRIDPAEMRNIENTLDSEHQLTGEEKSHLTRLIHRLATRD